jgi:hypothetical protein
VVIRLGTMAPSSAGRSAYNGRMPKSLDFKLPLTRVIEPTGGPGAELATLEDAAHFVGHLRPFRQRHP